MKSFWNHSENWFLIRPFSEKIIGRGRKKNFFFFFKPPFLFFFFLIRAQFKHENLLNLSILLGRGKEINWDSLSNCEWRGNSSSRICWYSFINRGVGYGVLFLLTNWPNSLERETIEGDSPVGRFLLGFKEYFFE